MVLSLARQGSLVFPEALDPQDQQALRDHLAHEDLRDHKGTKVTRGNQEFKASKVRKDLPEKRDLEGPQAERVHAEPKVTQVIEEAKEPQASRDLQGHWEVTGNSASSTI